MAEVGSALSFFDGVFAVDKPANISSGQVLLDLQAAFAKSITFAPLLAETQRKREEQEVHQGPRSKTSSSDRSFKMGHGGTLDPLASGVLIVGIGRGTRFLSNYLGCTKTYDVLVMFGKATDTYDITGVVTGEAAVNHLTRTLVDEKLAAFRGPILQMPPIYSALKIDGVKACEYARSGQAMPRQLERREVQVDECVLLEWLEPGSFESQQTGSQSAAGIRSDDNPAINTNAAALSPFVPAARIRLTVSSGFYVRSFAHDLGIACSSLATMAALRRIRQADYVVPKSSPLGEFPEALSYAALDAGEGAWGPVVQAQLARWTLENPIRNTEHTNGRDPSIKGTLASERESRPRQRFKGTWQASSKKERRRQHKEANSNHQIPQMPSA